MSGLFCINCFISVERVKRFYLSEDEKADKVFRRWTTILDEIPPEAAVVCKECWLIAIAIPDEDVPDAKQQFGHRSVCVYCCKSCMGKYLKNVWKENISMEESDLLKDIREIITKYVHPRPFNKDSKLCRTCYVRAYRKLQTTCPKYKKLKPVAESDVKEVDDVTSEEKTASKPISYIKLSDYIRAPEIHNKCFVEACNIEEAESPPLFMRQSLLKQCNFYIPKTCLVCTKHKTDWDFMAQPMEEIHVFKPEHVAGMLQLMSSKS